MNPAQSAIIFVNADISQGIKEALERQLFITESVTGAEFDARIAEDPNYPLEIQENNLRILVIRDYWTTTNRELADIVIFASNGLATVESNKFGPPAQTYPINSLTWDELTHGYPQGSTSSGRNPNVQDTIFYPLCPNPEIRLFPFGTDSIPKKPIF